MEKIKILLVDDEADFVQTLAERIKLRNLKSSIAVNGEEALQIVEDQVPDVMVLDLKMPGIDGMEVLKQVSQKYPEVKVIILTGHGSDKDERLAKELGAYDYLNKPVELDTLIDTIKNAYASKIEKNVLASTFAEAGDFDTAREILNKK